MKSAILASYNFGISFGNLSLLAKWYEIWLSAIDDKYTPCEMSVFLKAIRVTHL